MNGNGGFMIKKITAVITAIVLALHTLPVMATGEYYTHRELPKITQADFVYEAVDASALKKKIASIQNLLAKRGNKIRIAGLLEDCFEIYSDVSRAHALATLAYDRNCNDENFKNLNEATDVSVTVAELISGVIYDLYESDYSLILADMFGDIDTALYYALPDDEEISGLLDKEMEFKNRYYEIYGDSDACADLFVELVRVRNGIAKKFGYDNYAEYANADIYGREYTDEEINGFYKAVREYFVPIYEDAMLALVMSGGSSIPMSEDDVLLNARSVVKKINPELAESFEYLIANNVYDIRISETKNPGSGAYTVIVPKINVPFIYINPTENYEENGIFTVTTLIHEFGHFASMLNTPEAVFGDATAFLTPCIDTAEIHSQGLEAMAERYYGELFGSGASTMRYYLLCSLVGSIIDGCLFNQWQEQVYAMENPTVESINIVLAELVGEYYGECTPEDAQEVWTQVVHNYQMPMYYLSYALSAVTVLGLYSESVTDYDGAVDKYMRISAEGIYKSFAQITKECDLYDIYDADVLKAIAEKTEDAYALGYSDVAEGDWFAPYLYSVSNLMHGRTDDEFMPDTAITRAEFVGALGRMYDYYVGIDAEYETVFSDAGNDENTEYIAWAAENGIVDGYDDKTFGATDPLTREQAAAIIFRLTGETSESTDVSVFEDAAAISDWAKAATAWAVENGIIDGRDNGEFDPKASITRAETAKIVSCYIYSEY